MTSSDHLLRDHAPIPVQSWKQIDDEARQRLTPHLAARRLTEWTGPGGWRHDRLTIGRTAPVAPPPGANAVGARTLVRRVLPHAEIRIPFTVARSEIADIQRGASDADFDDLDRAAREAAVLENRAVFHGWPDAGITGLVEYSSFPGGQLGEHASGYPTAVAIAVDTVRNAGIEGPYALAISPAGYTAIVETTEHGGYPLIDHLTRILGGPVVRSPGLDGAVLLTQRGGDYLLDVGQDWSVGYLGHDADTVTLYLEESFTFWPTEPDGIVALG